MSRLLFLGLWACATALALPVAAQPSRLAEIRGAVEREDGPEEAAARRTMRNYAGCVVRHRRRFAESALALPYLGSEQNALVRRRIGGFDPCIGDPGLELRFRLPSMVGGMAEQMIATRFGRAGVEVIGQLTDADLERHGLAPRNGYEQLALCVLRRDPAAVREFIMSVPAAVAERTAGRRLVLHLGPCIDEGHTMTLDLPGLRALLAPTLYRVLVALGPAEGRT